MKLSKILQIVARSKTLTKDYSEVTGCEINDIIIVILKHKACEFITTYSRIIPFRIVFQFTKIYCQCIYYLKNMLKYNLSY